MSSILTNNSAMIALQTLKSVNSNLQKTQGEISTGKSVASARDNAAVWAISKVMESDVKGFKGISDSLSLGQSTVAVARNASETITDLLTDIKGKIVAAQESNVDRSKIQTDIGQLRGQINSVVNAAQFNGLNLVKGGGGIEILSSLDRSEDGTVTDSAISVAKQDLGIAVQEFGDGAVAAAGDLMTTDFSAGTDIDDGNGTGTVSFTSGGAAEGASYRITLAGVANNEFGTDAVNFEYVARDGDTELDVSRQLESQINAYLTEEGNTTLSVERDETTGALTFTNSDTDAGDNVALTIAENQGGTAGGGLAALSGIDVTTSEGADDALEEIEALIQTSINASAAFGSAEGRIDTQSNFVSKLMDSLKSGIGTLVDANMEEASARLQALQVQQQLATQSLSIANQAPQNILALFR